MCCVPHAGVLPWPGCVFCATVPVEAVRLGEYLPSSTGIRLTIVEALSIIVRDHYRGEYFPKKMKLFPDGDFQSNKHFPENGV